MSVGKSGSGVLPYVYRLVQFASDGLGLWKWVLDVLDDTIVHGFNPSWIDPQFIPNILSNALQLLHLTLGGIW